MTTSAKLEAWLKDSTPKTFHDLSQAFGKQSFAIAFILLMSLSALPLPTGGLTHIFEIITIIIATELLMNRKTIWLPQKLRMVKLGQFSQTKSLPFLVSSLRWFEKYSKVRLGATMQRTYISRLAGFFVALFALTAFLAPPFSGLDTLPSIAVLIIGLSLILEDALFFAGGIVLGLISIGFVFVVGRLVFKLL